MRKKTVKFCADTIFWYILYMLPVVAYLIYMWAMPSAGTTVVAFNEFVTSAGFGILTENIIFNCFNSLFGINGLFPVFANTAIFMFMSWFVFVYLCHLIVDILLFLPRLAHKVMDKYTDRGA